MAETWIDTRNGELLIGAEAAADRIDEAGPDIVPLVELLTVKDFPFENGDFGSIAVRGWTYDHFINFGHWVLNILSQEETNTTKSLTKEHLVRLHTLGFCPSLSIFSRTFTTLWNYRMELDAEPGRDNGRYRDWTIADYVAYASKLARSCKGKPKEKDYLAADGPSPLQIKRYTGEGISMLNELIGYPNIRNMDEHDFIDWGVKVMEANDGRLSAPILKILSSREQGPGVRAVMTKFVSIPQFREQVQERYEASEKKKFAARQEKIAEYRRLQEEWELPKEVANLSDDKAVVFIAKYWVAMKCLPGISTDVHIDVASNTNSFVTRLRRSYLQVSSGDIETAALRLGVFDDIWPMDQYKRHLRVSEKELERIRAYDRTQKRKRRPNEQ